MSDPHLEPPPPDLQLVAELIDSSSLGSDAAFEALNDVPPDHAMELRDRTRQDVPNRAWLSLPESDVVLRTIASDVFPNVDGSFTLRASAPPNVPLFAISRDRRRYLTLDRAALALPGGADRQHWIIYVAETGRAFRWETQATLAEWGVHVHAAIWWELAEPEKAASKGWLKLPDDLILQVSDRFRGRREATLSTVGKQILFEYALSQYLLEGGVVAECAIQVRPISNQARPVPGPPSGSGETTTASPSPFPQQPESSVPGWRRRPPLIAEETPSRHDRGRDLFNMMMGLAQEGHIRESERYRHLVATFHPLPRSSASIRGVAYLSTLLEEALRILGVQIDEAVALVSEFLTRLPGYQYVQFEMFLEDDDPRSPDVIYGFAEAFLQSGGSTSFDLRRPIIPLPPTPHQGMEARREDRYQFDDLLT